MGCGSMGLLLAARLAMAGGDAALVCRRGEQVVAINEGGVRVYSPGGVGEARVPAAHVSSAPRSAFDAVVVAVKAYDTVSAVDVVRHVARRGALVLSLQNGIGPLEILEQRLGGAYTVLGVVAYVGARRVSDNEVEYAGGRRLVVGPRRGEAAGPEVDELAELLRRGGFDVEVVSDVEPWRWDKLAVNAAVNPITAVLGVPNGAIARSEHLMGLAENVVREVELVARAEGVKLPRDPLAALREAVEATSSNKSSMLQDIEARRPTEVDFINGVVVRLAVKHGIHVPYNEALYLLVKSVEDLYDVEKPPREVVEALWKVLERGAG